MKIKTYISFLLLTFSLGLTAQRYPVQVSTMVTPPYSVYLNEYGSDAYDRLQVTVTALDMTRVNYPVKLKLIIESFDGKIQLETSPNYLPPPFYLQGGIPEVLTSYDLQGHFNLNNLVTSGIDRNELLRTGRLPEGYYRIGFEVLDYNRATIGNEVVVSNYGYMTAGLFLNDPPIINLPLDGVVLEPFEPQNIMFSWTPRHKGSPNSAFTAEYIFRIYEVWNSWQDPNITVQTQLPIYETSVMNTSLVYGPAEPALIHGKEYVFTVQARDIQGRDLFRNNGVSEAFMFTYGEECLPPEDITPDAINGPGIDLHWKTADAHTDYNVEYRTAGNSGDWFTDNTLLDNHSIYELQYNTQYEVRIQSVCGTGTSEYCEPLLVTTIDEQQQQFMCGGDPGIPVVTNSNPQPNLIPGSIFYAGGYECKVTKVSGRDGTFSGECLVTIPYYGYAKVRHSFENIFVNELGQMSSGKLVSLVSDSDDYMVDLNPNEWGDDDTDEVQAAAMALALEADTLWQIDGIIKNISYSGNTIIVTTDNGETLEFEDKNNGKVLVSDEAGNRYFVDNGNISNAADTLAAVSGSEAQQVNNIDSLVAVLPHIYFNPSKDQQFGYDSLQHDALHSMYGEVTLHDKTYIPAWKAVSTQKADYVEARLPVNSSLDINSFGFKTSSSPVPAFPAEDDTKRKLTVSTPLAGDTDYLSVYYSMQDTAGNTREEELGRLNLAAYEPLVNTVCIVPVNGAEKPVASKLQSSFKDIFGQAVAGWNVIVDENFYISQDEYDKDGDKTFEDDDNDDLMDYTREMKVLINAYKDQYETYDKNTYYIFLMDEPLKEGTLKGYMPLKHQCGFVFTEKAGEGEVLARNIAHELAHGAYRLRHSFSNKNEYYQTQYSTENLMDYTEGSCLNKYQWDLIHDPESMILTWLEEEDEGEDVFGFITYFNDITWPELFPDFKDDEEKLNETVNLYNYVAKNYSLLFSGSIKDDFDLPEEYKGFKNTKKIWSVRKSSHDNNDRVGNIIKNIKHNSVYTQVNPDEIYVKILNDLVKESVAVAVFANESSIDFDKPLIARSTDLNKKTKIKVATFTNSTNADYILLAFYQDPNKNPSFVFQLIPESGLDKTIVDNLLKELWILGDNIKVRGFIDDIYESNKEGNETINLDGAIGTKGCFGKNVDLECGETMDIFIWRNGKFEPDINTPYSCIRKDVDTAFGFKRDLTCFTFYNMNTEETHILVPRKKADVFEKKVLTATDDLEIEEILKKIKKANLNGASKLYYSDIEPVKEDPGIKLNADRKIEINDKEMYMRFELYMLKNKEINYLIPYKVKIEDAPIQYTLSGQQRIPGGYQKSISFEFYDVEAFREEGYLEGYYEGTALKLYVNEENLEDVLEYLEIKKTPIPLVVDINNFEKQQCDSCCYFQCQQILKKEGYVNGPGTGDRIYLACNYSISTGEYAFHNKCLNKGIKIIDEYLESGKPIIVGVDRMPKKNINDYVTDHFVIIVAREIIDNKIYYRFFDVGSSRTGTNSSNKFLLTNEGLLEAVCPWNINQKYYVVMIRPNKGFTFNCCDFRIDEDDKSNCIYTNQRELLNEWRPIPKTGNNYSDITKKP